MPRVVVVVVGFALAFASSPVALSKSTMPPGFKVAATAQLYTGVSYAKLANPKAPVVAHVARVAPGAPVDLHVVNAGGKVSTSPRELEPTSSICGRVNCIAGLNGDFHKGGTPVGGVVASGQMLRSPDPARSQLIVTGDGRLSAGPLPWTGSVSAAEGVKIPVTAVNAAPGADGLALFTPAFGTRTEASGREELVVRVAGGKIGSLNAATDLQVKEIRTGAGPIPPDGAVLSAEGATAQQLRDLWSRMQRNGRPRAQLHLSSPIDVEFSLGVEPVVLRDGRRALPWRDPNVIVPRQPHTLVAWNKSGETFLVAVDGRQAGSEGMSMAEAADFLLALGATEAVNLDGGGGTTFVAGDSVWNRPSDNNPARPTQYEQRGTPNAFLVMPRPGAPVPPAKPPAPKPVPIQPMASVERGSGTTEDSAADALPWDEATPETHDGPPTATIADRGAHLAGGELPVGPGRDTQASARPGAARLAEAGITAPPPVAGGPAPPGASGETTPGDRTAIGEEGLAVPAGSSAEAMAVPQSAGRPGYGMKAAAAATLLPVLTLLIWRRRRRSIQGSTTRSSRWITSCGAPSGRSLVREPARAANATEL